MNIKIKSLFGIPFVRLVAQRGALLLILGSALFLLGAQLSKRASAIATQRSALAESQAKFDAAVVLRAQSKNLEGIRGRLGSLLLSETDVLQFVTLMEAISAGSGNQMKLLFTGEGKAAASQKVSGVLMLPFSLTLQGTESSFSAFLERFAASSHLARLTSIDIEGASGISAFSTLKANGELFLKP